MKDVMVSRPLRYDSDPLEAWAGSCVVALLIPVFTGLGLALARWLAGHEDAVILAAVGFFGMPVHFGALLVFGVPVFYFFWDCETCDIWKGLQGYLLGGALGGFLVWWVIPGLFALVGIFYGLVTAFAAQRAGGKVRLECER